MEGGRERERCPLRLCLIDDSCLICIDIFQTVMTVEDDPISQVIVCGQIVSTPEIHRIFLIRNGHVSTSAKLKIGVSYFMVS